MARRTCALLLTGLLSACGASSTPRTETVRPAVTEPVRIEAGVEPSCSDEEWVHLDIRIGFPVGGASIETEGRAQLAEVGARARALEHLERVRVEGHTDGCLVETGSNSIAYQRALNVATELVTVGIDRQRVEVVSYGSTSPRAAQQCAPDAPDENRRVEFSFLVSCGGPPSSNAGAAEPPRLEGSGIGAWTSPTSSACRCGVRRRSQADPLAQLNHGDTRADPTRRRRRVRRTGKASVVATAQAG